jgi:hypothetical protein
VDVGVWLLTAAYWKVASGEYTTALKLQKVHPRIPKCRIGLLTSGWWGYDFYCGAFGMVYDCCDDGC